VKAIVDSAILLWANNSVTLSQESVPEIALVGITVIYVQNVVLLNVLGKTVIKILDSVQKDATKIMRDLYVIVSTGLCNSKF